MIYKTNGHYKKLNIKYKANKVEVRVVVVEFVRVKVEKD